MIYIPENIRHIIGHESYKIDEVGKSSSTILLFDDRVLKIQESNEETHSEYKIMDWLQDKLPVPKILSYKQEDGKDYLLMSRVQGKMSCDDEYLSNLESITSILADGLKMLWQVDISNCPINYSIDKKLEMAKYTVEHGLVLMDEVEEETFGEDGFQRPSHLLQWLIDNKPQEEYVLSHGDYCLPNILVKDGRVSGFIDLGKTGISDKWQDIALCYRSLLHNYTGVFGGPSYEGFKAELLFETLGIEPNWEKIRYYILLDELF